MFGSAAEKSKSRCIGTTEEKITKNKSIPLKSKLTHPFNPSYLGFNVFRQI